MRDDKLMHTLRSMVRKHGLSRVQQSLADIASSDHLFDTQQGAQSPGKEQQFSAPDKRMRTKASDYVDKMDVPLETKEALKELAKKFERKLFLPTVADIRNFCRVHRIQVPDSTSRSNAFPRLFKFMATMGANDIRRVVEDGMFSGPSRLEPIADAIRSRSRTPRPQDGSSAASISIRSTKPKGSKSGSGNSCSAGC